MRFWVGVGVTLHIFLLAFFLIFRNWLEGVQGKHAARHEEQCKLQKEVEKSRNDYNSMARELMQLMDEQFAD